MTTCNHVGWHIVRRERGSTPKSSGMMFAGFAFYATDGVMLSGIYHIITMDVLQYILEVRKVSTNLAQSLVEYSFHIHFHGCLSYETGTMTLCQCRAAINL